MRAIDPLIERKTRASIHSIVADPLVRLSQDTIFFSSHLGAAVVCVTCKGRASNGVTHTFTAVLGLLCILPPCISKTLIDHCTYTFLLQESIEAVVHAIGLALP